MAIANDERNLGGRKYIYSQLLNHKRALINVRPTMNVHMPPKAHVDQGGQFFGDNPGYTQVYETGAMSYNPYLSQMSNFGKKKLTMDEKLASSPEFVEVRETFKRISGIKGGVDHKKPKTFAMSKKINQNRRRNMYHFEEHIKNLASLQKRLNSIGSVQDRQKNPCDPIMYPSYFFRKPEEFDRSTSLSGFTYKVQKNLEKTKRVAQKYEQIIMDEIIHKYNRRQDTQQSDYDDQSRVLNSVTDHKHQFDHLMTPQSNMSRSRPPSSKKPKFLISPLIQQTGTAQPITRGYRPVSATISQTPQSRPYKAMSLNIGGYNNTIGAQPMGDYQHTLAQISKLHTGSQTQKHSKRSRPQKKSGSISNPNELNDRDLTSQDLKTLEKKIVNRIVNERLYKNEQLEQLLEEAISCNKNTIGQEEVIKIFQNVKNELDSS